MIENSSATEQYFAWDPQADPDFAPMIAGEGAIGGKGRSLLFAIRKLRDSEDAALRKVVIPESLFVAVGVFDALVAALGGSGQFRNMPPDEYGGSVSSTSTDASGNCASMAHASPW